ncbi:hypothetical protein [Brucella pituitosa]|uniref:hypothetical protein n=1 Tax=Brucella pituitosa TaxID=571256 RepID=UPI003F4AC53A
MAASNLPTVSDGLQTLVQRFEKFNGIANAETLPMTGEDGRYCLTLLRSLYHLALIQERELGAMRVVVGDAKAKPEHASHELPASREGKVVQFPCGASSKPKLVKTTTNDPA